MSSLVSLIAPKADTGNYSGNPQGEHKENDCTPIIFVFLLFFLRCLVFAEFLQFFLLDRHFPLGLVFAEFLQFFLLIRHEVRGIRTGEQRRGSFSCE